MKRAHFIQSMLTLTGTAFIYGCKDVVDGIEDPLPDTYSSPTISGAKKWFTDSYLGSMANARTQKTSVDRKLDWDNSKKVKKGKHDFIWVPVTYEADQLGTALLMWREGEEYVQRLAQYLSWSISEGFVAYRKPNGEYDGFLAQMAFDPTMTDISKPIDVAKFTGMVVNADLNEKPLRSWRFLEGKMISYSNPDGKKEDRQKEKGARTDCYTYYTTYTSVWGQSCGMNCHEVFYTVHSVPHTFGCGDANGSDPGYMGSGANNSGDWYGYGSGGGTPPPQPTPITNKTQLATNPNSWERTEFNKRLTDIMSAVGLGVSTLDLSLAKATTIANALSLSNTGVKVALVPTVTGIAGTATGIGVITSAYSLAIGIKKDGYDAWGQDGLNTVAVLAGIGALATLASPIGWWTISLSLASSGISVGIAVYDEYTKNNP